MRAWVTLVLAACAAPAGAPTPPPAPAPKVALAVSRFTLPNGLRVVVNEDHARPAVAVQLVTGAGTRDEQPGQLGLAHLYEHMNSATRALATPENREAYYGQTLDSNAQTRMDYVRYFALVPAPALDLALAVMSDRLDGDPEAIAQDRLDRDRPIVLNEMRRAQERRERDPRLEAIIRRALFGADHPYGHEVYGSTDDIAAVSLEVVRAWARRHRGAAGAVLVLSGDVDATAAHAAALRWFGPVAPGVTPGGTVAWRPAGGGRRRDVVRAEVTRAFVQRSFVMPPWGDADASELDLFVEILVGGDGARLQRRLIDGDALAETVAVARGSWQLAGELTLQVTLRPGGQAAAAETAIDEEIAHLLQDGPTPAELAEARARVLAQRIAALQPIGFSSERLTALAEGELFLGDPTHFRVELDRISRAGASSITAAAGRWLGGCRAQRDGTHLVPRARAREARGAGLGDRGHTLVVEPAPAYQAAGAAPDRGKLPATPPMAAPAFPAVQRARLKNGLDLLVVESHDLPLVTMRLQLDTTAAAAPGVGPLALALLQLDDDSGRALPLTRRLGALGALLETATEVDQAILEVTTLRAHLDETLHLLGGALARPSFPAAELERQRAARLAAVATQRESPLAARWRLLSALLGGSPLGATGGYALRLYPELGASAVEALARPELVAFAGAALRPDRAALIVVGDVTLAALVPMLEASFARWTAGAAPAAPATAAAAPRPGVYLIDSPGAAQSFLVVAQPLPPGAPDLAAVAASSLLKSRLNSNLREKNGWSYGVQTILAATRQRPLWYAETSVQADKTGAAFTEISAELRRLGDAETMTPVELAQLRRNVTRELAASLESPSDLAAAIGDLVRLQQPLDQPALAGRALGELGAEAIAAAARARLHPEQLIWIIVGDRATVAPQLEKLGPVHPVARDEIP